MTAQHQRLLMSVVISFCASCATQLIMFLGFTSAPTLRQRALMLAAGFVVSVSVLALLRRQVTP